MYESYFGFTEAPFSIAPNPRYLYLSANHREAMAHLLYGVREGGGFVQLTGEVGTGKTTLCRQLLSELPDNVDVALILNPRINERELMLSILDELHIDHSAKASTKQLLDRLNAFLLEAHAEGRNIVLLIDEAQNLKEGVLEQIRLLTNLETAQKKLLQIILVGQTELRDLLSKRSLRQLSQRITARYHLEPLDRGELHAYLAYRLRQSGSERDLFTRGAARCIYKKSGGIPRLINVICDRALLGAYSKGKTRVTRSIVNKAAREVLGTDAWKGWRWAIITGLMLVLLAAPVAAWRMGWLPESAHRIMDSLIPNLFHNLTQTVSGTQFDRLISKAHADATGSVQLVANTALSASGSHTGLVQNRMEPYVVSGYPFTTAAELEKNIVSLPARLKDRSGGLGRLLGVWALDSSVMLDCLTVKEVGLDCLKTDGGWQSLLRLDRPALIDLKRNGKSMGYLVLLKLFGDVVLVSVGEDHFRMRWDELDKLWDGTALVLWRPPPLSSIPITDASDQDDIDWLRRALNLESLNTMGDGLSVIESGRFDTELLDLLNRFQHRNGLELIDKAGVRELVILNSHLGIHWFPRLSTK